MRPLHLAPLVLTLLAVFALRWIGAQELALDAAQARAIPSAVLIDDASTCAHLRGVALALPLARAPERDAFLDPPDGAERPCLPFFDTLAASLANRLLGADADGVGPSAGLDARGEAQLERALVRVPALLGLLTALCVWAAVRAACRGPAREWCALLAAGIVGLAPASIAVSSAGRLDPLAWCAFVLALLAWIVAHALRTHGLREGLIAALLAGACAGLLCASLLVGALFFLAACAGFAARAWRANEEERRGLLREALLFGAVAAFAGQLPLSDQPELGTGAGTLAHAWQAAIHVVLLACVPLLVAHAFGRGRSGRFFSSAVAAVGIVVSLYFVPAIVSSLGAAWDAYRASAPVLALFDPGSRSLVDPSASVGPSTSVGPASWLALTPLVLALPWALWVLWTRAEIGERVWLAGATCVGLGLALVERRFAALALVPMACAIARAVDLVAFSADERSRVRRCAFATLAALALLIGCAFLARAPRRAPDERVARVELVRALRWMRAATPSPVAFVGAAPSYGVLVAPQDASLALYHARRPVLHVPEALGVDLEGLRRTLDVLAGGSEEALLRHMRQHGARYLVVSPAQVRATLELERASAVGREIPPAWRARSDSDSMLWRLACADEGDAPVSENLRAVYRSSERAIIAGSSDASAEGPAASVYELTGSAPAEERPSLSPR